MNTNKQDTTMAMTPPVLRPPSSAKFFKQISGYLSNPLQIASNTASVV